MAKFEIPGPFVKYLIYIAVVNIFVIIILLIRLYHGQEKYQEVAHQANKSMFQELFCHMPISNILFYLIIYKYTNNYYPLCLIRFRFDFETRTGGCAFVINPRFHAGQIVRNTDQFGNGAWGAEERAGPFCFAKGQVFDMIITVNPHSYSVGFTFFMTFFFKID